MTDAPAAESPPRATEPASPMARPGAESAPAADTPSLASTPRRDAAFAAAETPRTAPQAVAAQSEDFSVDSKGDGSGRIVSARGDVFTGEFKAWRRHGFGIQHWRTGEVYEGTWDSDRQHEGALLLNRKLVCSSRSLWHELRRLVYRRAEAAVARQFPDAAGVSGAGERAALHAVALGHASHDTGRVQRWCWWRCGRRCCCGGCCYFASD